MPIVPLVLHDGTLGELCIHVEIAITEEDHGYVLCHDDPHGSLELHWESLLKVGPSAQICLHKFGELLLVKDVCCWHGVKVYSSFVVSLCSLFVVLDYSIN